MSGSLRPASHPAPKPTANTTPPVTSEAVAFQNVKVFKDLQKMEGVGLVVPVGEEHMYYAAMNSTACRLTALGAQYWRLAKEKKL